MLETLPRGELTRRAQEIAARLYDIPYSTRRQVSVDTLLEWTLRYRRNSLAALYPKEQLPGIGASLGLDRLLAAMEELGLVEKVAVSEYIVQYVSRLVRSTRPKDENSPKFIQDLVDWGAGPRACGQAAARA